MKDYEIECEECDNISYVASSILVQLDTSGSFYLDALAKKKFILIRIALVLVVEIVEGPLSVSYGTNALAGTINLITKKNKKKFGGNVDAYYETIGQYNLNGRVDLALKSHSFSFSLGRNFFDGYSQLDTSRVMEWKPKEQVFGNFKYSNTYKKIS